MMPLISLLEKFLSPADHNLQSCKDWQELWQITNTFFQGKHCRLLECVVSIFISWGKGKDADFGGDKLKHIERKLLLLS